MTSVPESSAVPTESNGMTSQVLTDAVHITPIQGQDLLLADDSLNMTSSPSTSGEPPTKRLKHDDENLDQSQTQSIKQLLFTINKAICLRLDAIENKLETVSLRTKYLEEKVEQMVVQLRHNPMNNPQAMSTPKPGIGRRNNAVIVGIPSEKPQTPSQVVDSKEALAGLLAATPQRSFLKDTSERPDQIQVLDCGQSGSLSPGSVDPSIQNLGPNVTLITLNSEEDFPNGCWLGDENNPEMRVRIPLSPSDLLHIHSNCRTPEKMALALLDYLFDRETQACSNLSGMGKHGKKQLDPLMIYGIRCHLITRFGVSEQDWHRIKQNIDSKCRTAFRRKIKGLPLTVKAFRGKAPPTYVHVQQSPGGTVHEIGAQSDDSLQQDDAELHIQETEVDMTGGLTASSAAEILQNAGGQFQVVHATPEQVAQLHQAQHIQIIQGDQVMQFNPGGEGPEGLQVAVSMGQRLPEGIQVVSENGDTIQITQNPIQDDDTDTQDTEQ